MTRDVSLFASNRAAAKRARFFRKGGFISDYRVIGLAASLLFVATSASTTQQKGKTVKAKSAPATVTSGAFTKDILPITNKFCVTCHQGNDAPAGLNMAKFKTEASVKSDLATWERIARAMDSGSMPPKGMPAPTKTQRQAVSEWIERTISADCRLAEPGRVTIRRLNREEYNNTIRDLLGLDIRPADDFPSDDVGYGFDNIGDVLSISPLLMEKYLDAAEKISKQAVYIPGAKSASYQAEEHGGNIDAEFAGIFSPGAISVDHQFVAGLYKLKIRAFQDKAGPEDAKMLIKVGGKAIQQFDVAALRKAPAIYELPLKAEAGKQKISVEFINDYYLAPNALGPRDRNLWIDYIEVAGPLGGTFSMPDSHRRIIPGEPPVGKERDYARRLLGNFASKAYRRPAAPEEVERLMQVFDLAMKYKEPFERGIQLGVQATLVSPHFLFRAEVDPKTNPTASRNLNGYELATRLSYFLWSSTPDDRLLGLAADGSLAKPAILNQEVKRMLKDPKAKALADNFAEQWLTLRRLANVNPDPKQFPTFTKQLKDSMAEETKLFFNDVVANDRSVLDFIDGKFTYVNGLLAKHYGLPGTFGSEFKKVSLVGTNRGGVLSHASVLTVTSNPTRTSPTKRGRWVLEQILGTPPPPPPPGVDVLADENKVNSAKTLREKMMVHQSDPNCFSCHSKMDPLGFGLENYDAIGGWRTSEGDTPVDSSGVLPDGTKFAGPTQLKSLLMKDKDQFMKSLSEKMLTYGLGRGVSFEDRCHIDTIAQQTAKSGYKFSALVTAIVNSDPFKKRQTK